VILTENKIFSLKIHCRGWAAKRLNHARIIESLLYIYWTTFIDPSNQPSLPGEMVQLRSGLPIWECQALQSWHEKPAILLLPEGFLYSSRKRSLARACVRACVCVYVEGSLGQQTINTQQLLKLLRHWIFKSKWCLGATLQNSPTC
jgi:hypothetical protein